MRQWPIIIASLFFLQGCAMIPWQLSIALNGADLISATTTNKTMGEHLISSATGKDCQWYRLLDSEKVCMTQKEEEAYLKEQNCKVHAWSVFRIHFCKELLMPIKNPMLPKIEDDEPYCDPMGVRNCPKELEK